MRNEILLSAVRASPRRRHTAFIVGLIVFAGFIATAPIAQIKLARFPAVIPILNTTTFLNDTLTAILLFGQYAVSRARSLCILAFGFLFTALMAISHMLSFPEALSPTGLLGGGSQETAWLYVAWHAVLPLAIIAYSMYRPDRNPDRVTAPLAPIFFTTAAAVCSAVAITWIIAAQNDWLFTINEKGRLLPASKIVVAMLLLLPATALLLLFVRSQPAVLDLWLMVVMFTWLCTISLVSFVSAERYDAGWYAGRFFQTLTSVFVLIVLISEIIGLYARDYRAAAAERRAQARRINEMEAVLLHLSRSKEEFSRSALTLIHEIGQPIASISLLAHASLENTSNITKHRLRQTFEMLAEQSEKIKGILEETRNFIRGKQPQRGFHQVKEAIDHAIKLATAGEASSLAIVKRYHSAAAEVHFFNRMQIEQVVFNLARNAVEAIADVEQPILTVGIDHAPEGVIISIADNGPGISPRVRTTLFHPFVSTKEDGLGIGLSICQLIIQAHGSRLQVKDNPGGGSIFYFILPRSTVDAPERALATSAKKIASR